MYHFTVEPVLSGHPRWLIQAERLIQVPQNWGIKKRNMNKKSNIDNKQEQEKKTIKLTTSIYALIDHFLYRISLKNTS